MQESMPRAQLVGSNSFERPMHEHDQVAMPASVYHVKFETMSSPTPLKTCFCHAHRHHTLKSMSMALSPTRRDVLAEHRLDSPPLPVACPGGDVHCDVHPNRIAPVCPQPNSGACLDCRLHRDTTKSCSCCCRRAKQTTRAWKPRILRRARLIDTEGLQKTRRVPWMAIGHCLSVRPWQCYKRPLHPCTGALCCEAT